MFDIADFLYHKPSTDTDAYFEILSLGQLILYISCETLFWSKFGFGPMKNCENQLTCI